MTKPTKSWGYAPRKPAPPRISETQAELEALLPSLLDQAFRGEL